MVRFGARAIVVVAVAAVVATGCTSGTRPHPRSASPSVSAVAGPPDPTTALSDVTPSPSPSAAPDPPTSAAQLPLGGRTLLPRYRVVAYYGAPGNGALGALGRWSPDAAAAHIQRTAAQYAGFGRPVQPAMELIATVAQASAGPDGLFSAPVSQAAVAQYLAAAHRHKMLLILDFQPGRGAFLPQVKQFASFLTDPSVGVALDPEWKVGPHQRPAQVIGQASAASINAVGAYLAGIVRAHNLPQKLFVLHEFTLSMIPNRTAVVRHPELATVFHADGHGSIANKRAIYKYLHFPRDAGAGFKLFFREDPKLMTPVQVMHDLSRPPDLITYE
jgi:hypothetical protein